MTRQHTRRTPHILSLGVALTLCGLLGVTTLAAKKRPATASRALTLKMFKAALTQHGLKITRVVEKDATLLSAEEGLGFDVNRSGSNFEIYRFDLTKPKSRAALTHIAKGTHGMQRYLTKYAIRHNLLLLCSWEMPCPAWHQVSRVFNKL